MGMLILLYGMLAIVVFAFCFCMFLFYRAARREMRLCAALVKHMEVNRQAERKIINMDHALAMATHDIRTSIAAIISIIELCRRIPSKTLELDSNLEQMNSCATNMLAIMNSVLDASKIEAGKMQLEEGEFDLAETMEEVADIFYGLAIKNGVEVIMDLYDGTVERYRHVKGDCGKLKQVLSNLLSNAVKFTTEGHIVVRALIKKPIMISKASIANSHHKGYFFNSWGCIMRWLSDSDEAYEFNVVQADSDSLEFICEVDDSGKGIPKDKHETVFENYIQVKESVPNNIQGTGLGLGIVKSLVRLMGGDIHIKDKEPGERGTCFKFNIFLRGTERFDLNLGQTNALGGLVAHTVLLIQGEVPRQISQKWMSNQGFKVWMSDGLEDLFGTLERLKSELFLSSFRSLESLELNSVDSYRSDHSMDILTRRVLKRSTSHIDLVHHSTRFNIENACILMVIDMACGPFSKLSLIISDFIRSINNLQFKVVWLTTPITSSEDLEVLESGQVPCNLVLRKPFHWSRLHKVLQLVKDPWEENDSDSSQTVKIDVMPAASSSTRLRGNFDGMKVLVVEDNILLRRLATANLSRLGALVEICENGEDALNRVIKALRGKESASKEIHEIHEDSSSSPFDIILMDCEMPIMNGYEATRRIREEERRYGIHIPIIALSAHVMPEETNKSIQSGMDFHLTKPLQMDSLLDAINRINR
ncbi:probable histidine kinase 2 [Amborella trichopoda]|uniref:probable histidine kinase 2 n=1 Tax=Amborella trichopoda TaxID=13333 RepID=UPI0005D431E3|nr:probable histidine kinase 2 [Amborella trichopoda]|eukprot:XP_006857668.2 probable histidine kinase 2 [Amborella trichopoda]